MSHKYFKRFILVIGVFLTGCASRGGPLEMAGSIGKTVGTIAFDALVPFGVPIREAVGWEGPFGSNHSKPPTKKKKTIEMVALDKVLVEHPWLLVMQNDGAKTGGKLTPELQRKWAPKIMALHATCPECLELMAIVYRQQNPTANAVATDSP